jgi:hypothetical protein
MKEIKISKVSQQSTMCKLFRCLIVLKYIVVVCDCYSTAN